MDQTSKNFVLHGSPARGEVFDLPKTPSAPSSVISTHCGRTSCLGHVLLIVDNQQLTDSRCGYRGSENGEMTKSRVAETQVNYNQTRSNACGTSLTQRKP